MCLLASVYLFQSSIYSNLLPFLSCFPIIEFEELFIYSGHKSFIRYMLCKDFLSVCGLTSFSLKVSS